MSNGVVIIEFNCEIVSFTLWSIRVWSIVSIVAFNGNLPLPNSLSSNNAYDVIVNVDFLNGEDWVIRNRTESISYIKTGNGVIFPSSDTARSDNLPVSCSFFELMRAIKSIGQDYTPPFPNPERQAAIVDLASISA